MYKVGVHREAKAVPLVGVVEVDTLVYLEVVAVVDTLGYLVVEVDTLVYRGIPELLDNLVSLDTWVPSDNQGALDTPELLDNPGRPLLRLK